MIAPFVDAAWLERDRDRVVVADVRFYLDGRSALEAFEAEHIAGAVYVSLEDVLSAPVGDASRGRHPLPDPERFAAGLAAAGIGDGDTVVGYDDAGGVVAARLVWLLRAVGCEAAVLDGGLAAWPGSLEPGPGRAPRGRSRFTARPWPPALLVDIDEVARASSAAVEGSGGAVLVDARDPERFGGGPDPVDPRSGHIPGAVCIPARSQLDDDGRLAAAGVLRERFAAAGIGPETEVVSYCGSGVTACFNLLVLERAGLPAGRLYPGSWSEWSRDPSRPLEM